MTNIADFNLMTTQLEAAHWGWTIALFLWAVGLSGMGFFLNYWVRQKKFVYLLTAAAIIGTLLVVSHLARMLNLPFAVLSSVFDMALNLSSWMFIGICLLSLLCVSSLFYSMICAGILFKGEKWQQMADSNWFNGIFSVLGAACTVYSGFLLTQAVGIPFWNSAIIPILWIISGMACSVGAIELLMVFGQIDANRVKWSRTTSIWVEIAELLTIFAFLHVSLSSNMEAARVGAESLLYGPNALMFWLGVILFGSLVPLVATILTRSHKVLVCTAVLGIIGALLLRASVLFAGYYDPILM